MKGGGEMDIAALSPALNAAQLNSEIGIAMLQKSLSTEVKMSKEMIKMMEQSVNPHIGSNFDVSV